MNRVFIPNRGEIALRIVRACRELGLESVVGTSDADREGMAARAADRAVCIGPGPATDSYLRDDIIVQAALGTGCDAIHPGYGFLSESPRLAARARENGLIFVGPPPEVLELAGDKLQRTLACRCCPESRSTRRPTRTRRLSGSATPCCSKRPVAAADGGSSSHTTRRT
jgi:acetyl/propionyl-CoA carboxylase alpha subunit